MTNSNSHKSARKRYEQRSQRKILSISLTPAQYNAIRKAAIIDGTVRKNSAPTPSLYIKHVIQAHIDNHPPLPQHLKDELRSFRLEIRKVGTNINQAVRAANIKIKQEEERNKNRSSRKYVKIRNELQSVLSNLHKIEMILSNFCITFLRKDIL